MNQPNQDREALDNSLNAERVNLNAGANSEALDMQELRELADKARKADNWPFYESALQKRLTPKVVTALLDRLERAERTGAVSDDEPSEVLANVALALNCHPSNVVDIAGCVVAEAKCLHDALCFWLPRHGDGLPDAMTERIAADAYLLVGYEDAPDPKCAEELGWITTASTGAVAVPEGTAEKLSQIAHWMDASADMSQDSFDQPPNYTSKFDYELAEAARELAMIANNLRAAAPSAPEPAAAAKKPDFSKFVTLEEYQAAMREYEATTLPAAAPSEPVNEMRLTLIGQIQSLTDVAERMVRRMHKQGDTDERDYIQGAVDYAREVSEPYSYNGPYRATPPAALAAPQQRPSHETIVLEGDLLTCTACGVSAQSSHVLPPAAAPASQLDASEWVPVERAGQVKVGDRLRFTIGDQSYSERAKLILNAGTEKEEVIYNKRRNFYFITSMVLSGWSNHKNVEVAGRSRSQGGKDGA